MIYPIPEKALASHIAILGKAGSGKTWAAKGLVERVLDDNGRACVIDPTGVWHGLRTSATGKSAGYAVAIFGGEHGDFPLAGTHGEALAEIVATSSTPVIIDTSQMRVGERTRFFAEFAEAILRRNRGPLHLIVDEAHLFAPQGRVNDPQSGQMLHAANNMVSLGRARGLRVVLISQRPAKLHKDSLTQAETLVAMRLVAPQDRGAVEEWIEDNADEAKAREILSSLATLKTGQAWVWAPVLDVLERVTFPKIKTLDTSAAPTAGDREVERVLAPIDRDAITAKLGSIAKEAEANDPKKLRAQIAELQRELARKPQQSVDPAAIERAETQGFERGCAAAREAQRNLLDNVGASLKPLFAEFGRGVDTMLRELKPADPKDFTPVKTPVSPGVKPAQVPVKSGISRTYPRHIPGNGSGEKLSKAERLVLTALAQYPQGRTKVQVALLTGYAHTGGGFNNALSALRTKGAIEDHSDGRLTITDPGLADLGGYTPLPTGQELLRHWLGQLSKAEREILDTLAAAYPRSLTKEDLAQATPTGYEPNGGGFNNALSRLRTLELISGRGELRASEDLF